MRLHSTARIWCSVVAVVVAVYICALAVDAAYYLFVFFSVCRSVWCGGGGGKGYARQPLRKEALLCCCVSVSWRGKVICRRASYTQRRNALSHCCCCCESEGERERERNETIQWKICRQCHHAAAALLLLLLSWYSRDDCESCGIVFLDE